MFILISECNHNYYAYFESFGTGDVVQMISYEATFCTGVV
jgi:hypothetical protein